MTIYEQFNTRGYGVGKMLWQHEIEDGQRMTSFVVYCQDWISGAPVKFIFRSIKHMVYVLNTDKIERFSPELWEMVV